LAVAFSLALIDFDQGAGRRDPHRPARLVAQPQDSALLTLPRPRASIAAVAS
jgi:hypothetical protein